MQTELTLQPMMKAAPGKEIFRSNPNGLAGGAQELSVQRATSRNQLVSFARLCRRYPLFIVGALWPLVLLAPHVPGIPRAAIGGLPWRQELGLSLLLTVGLGYLLRQRRGENPLHIERRMLPVIVTFVALVAWTLASALWAVNPYAAIHLGVQWTTYLIFFLVLTSLFKHPALLRASLTTLAVVVCVLAIACALESWFGAPLTDGNLRGDLKPILRGSGGFGEIMALAAILFAAFSLTAQRRRQALFCGATAVMAWLATLQSLERAPLVGAASGFCLLLAGTVVMKQAAGRPWQRLLLLAAALGLVLFLQASPFSKTDSNAAATSTIDRFHGDLSADISTRARYLFWGVGLEMARAHPVLGVGGNNYETGYATARANFASRYPNSALVSLNEDLLTVYAHNEYVQVLAELGVVGLSLLVLFSGTLAVVFWRTVKMSSQVIPALGAGGAMFAFAISSGASGSSFRYFGGGLMFFFAAAMLGQLRITPKSPLVDEPNTRAYPARQFRQALAFVLLGATLLGSVVLSAQAAGTVLHGLAQSVGPTQAESYYLASLRVYPSSPATHFGYGSWLSTQHRDGEALAHLNYAVANGFNSSICYAHLAEAAESSGDLVSAERSLATAVSVYPRSVFLLVAYSSVLGRAGRLETSQSVFARAVLIDKRAAQGWQQLIDHDIDAAFAAARQDKNIAMPGELAPQTAVFEVLRENERRFPEATSTGWRARMQSLKTQ